MRDFVFLKLSNSGLYEDNQNDETKIETYLRITTSFLSQISSLEDDLSLTAYYRLLTEINHQKHKNNDVYYFNMEKFKEDTFYKDNIYINSTLQSVYQKAIFSDQPLFAEKVSNYLDNLISLKTPDAFYEDDDDFLNDFEEDFEEDDYDTDKNLLEEDEEGDDEYEDAEMISQEIKAVNFFYLSYISEIDKYLALNSDDNLELTKSRLIYLLDNSFLNLHNPANRNSYLHDNENLLNKDNFNNYYIMARLLFYDLIYETFTNEYTLKKILFIVNYYRITKDKRIKEMLSQHSNTKIGTLISNHLYLGSPIKLDNNPKKKTKKIDD